MPNYHGREAMRADPTVHARLSRYAAARPMQTILEHRGRQISRAGLERQAIAIGARLDEAGIGADRTVAVCLPRGIDQIAASLAIMKAGSACLPLSPSDPVEMRRFRMVDCDAAMLLVAADLDPRLAAAPGVAVMRIDSAQGLTGTLSRPGDADPFGAAVSLDPEPAAGAAFESHRVAWITPATGAGTATCSIEVTHANILFLSAWLGDECGIGAGDRVCQMADPAASTAMLEVWPALAAGATIVIMDDDVASTPDAVTIWIEEQRISALVAAEDAIEALAETPIRADAALRLVLTDLDHIGRFPAHPHFRLIATYGPEECGLVCAARRVARNERPGGPHIGRPIAGAAIHILDESGRKVAHGTEGEMWIAGPGVCRGYRNRPDLTAARFVPDPFGDDPAGMMFRTGRRGRALIGGAIGRSATGARARHSGGLQTGVY